METNNKNFWGMDEKTYLLVMHLGQLAGLILPLAGWVLPIVMWVTNKDNSAKIDEQGKHITNWIISAFIYAIGSALLIIVGIGVLLLIAVGILSIVFPIMGAVKSNNGEVWKYPLTISFIK